MGSCSSHAAVSATSSHILQDNVVKEIEFNVTESPKSNAVHHLSPKSAENHPSIPRIAVLESVFTSLRSSPGYLYATSCLDVEEMPKAECTEASYACAVRLRKLLTLAEKDELSKEDLIKNLQHTIVILEAVLADETKRLANEEEELPGMSAEVVPDEVRHWLTSTFTRRHSNTVAATSKPTFRSVANVIRAGIVVDRLFRRQSTTVDDGINPNLRMMLKDCDRWDFNIMELNNFSDSHALKVIGMELLYRYDIINKFKITPRNLECLLLTLEEGYSKFNNPYHNLIHAADVAQTCHCIIHQTKLVNLLSDLEIFAILFSALIHDYEHTGTTNNFHVKTGSELAMVYNDKGVLENFHVSSVYRLMKSDEKLTILSSLSREQYAEFRSMVVAMVLNTDMSLHFQQLSSVKNLLTVPENIDKPQALSLILHCADISHPSKPWEIHEQWTTLLLQEFFRQGDMEKELDLPCSPLCDRHATPLAQSQIGFITFIVEPSFNVLTDLLRRITASFFSDSNKKEENDHAINAKKNNTEFPTPWFGCSQYNKRQWEKRKAIEEKENVAAQ